MTDIPFSFKKNNDIKALPYDINKGHSNNLSVKSKVGRKPSSDAGVRNKQVSAYLAQSEWEALERKLDGRPASTVLRSLIMNYIDENESNEKSKN